jgi:lysophospholipase L1-like esterase
MYNLPAGSCKDGVSDMAMGYNGDLLALVGRASSCGGSGPFQQLISINPGNGSVKFSVALPGAPTQLNPVGNRLMPYAGGIAVLCNGMNVYYYSYSGTANSDVTFSPALPSGSLAQYATTTPSGRVYLSTWSSTGGSNISYKDVTGSAINTLVPPVGTSPLDIIPGPDNQVVLRWNIGQAGYTGTHGIAFYDASGTRLSSVTLSSDGSENLISDHPYVAIDSSGNAVVVRSMASGSQWKLYVDQFNSAGAKTRLLDMDAEFGTSSTDKFAPLPFVPESIGNGKIYVGVCTITTYTSYAYCPSGSSPTIVSVPTSASYSYSQSELYGALSQKLNYVALGDSYSSGEGLPSFIPPSDTTACDRSYTSYPGLLTNPSLFTYVPEISLQAFRACSGATTADIYTGKNGEPGQLTSLSALTDITTMTAGGNDVGFGDFAAKCVIGTCNSSSSEYLYAIDQITNYLPNNLDLLFDRIRTAAPNSEVYVIGYPYVTPPDGTDCTYFTDSEKTAANQIVDGLNSALAIAVSNQGSGFEFINPNAEGSPFIGHELCTEDPYFFGLNISEHRFSFHPNAAGQNAYANLVKNSLGL